MSIRNLIRGDNNQSLKIYSEVINIGNVHIEDDIIENVKLIKSETGNFDNLSINDLNITDELLIINNRILTIENQNLNNRVASLETKVNRLNNKSNELINVLNLLVNSNILNIY